MGDLMIRDPSVDLTRYLPISPTGSMLCDLKPPIFAGYLTDEKCAALEAGLRSHEAFTVRRCQILFASAKRPKPQWSPRPCIVRRKPYGMCSIRLPSASWDVCSVG
jgi:hypothetical protein